MKNLTHFDTLTDDLARVVYTFRSHRKFSDTEPSQAIRKPSLHTVLGVGRIQGRVGDYTRIEILAGDGWEMAE